MPEHERREIAILIYNCYAVLRDLSSEQNPVVSPWLWTQLHDAVEELGPAPLAPARTSPNEDTPSGLDPVTEAAWTRLRENRGSLRDVLLVLTTRDMNLISQDHLSPTSGPLIQLSRDIDVALRAHGFSGAQLRLKADIVDFAYNEYVAGGRVTQLPKFQSRGFRGHVRNVANRAISVLNPGSIAMQSLSTVPLMGTVLAHTGEAISFAMAAVEAGKNWRSTRVDSDAQG